MSRLHAHPDSSAVHGRVRLDARKSLWTGAMAVGTLAALLGPWDWRWIAASAALTVLTLCCGHSVGLHRGLIHGAFRSPLWLERALVWLATLAGIGGPLTLMRHHELRDWAQRHQAESHPWLGHQSPFARDLWQQVMCRLELERPPEIHIERPVAQDPVYRLLDRTWMAQQLPLAILCWMLGGWTAVLWVVCVRVFVSVVMHQVVGHLCHNERYGTQHEAQEGCSTQGYNNRLLGFLSMGEGWHNNHHIHPRSARLGLAPHEWDPGWWFICGLRRLGWASEVREAQARKR